MNHQASPPVFVGGLRTPFGRAGKGAYSEIRPDDLLVELFSAQAKKHRIPVATRPPGSGGRVCLSRGGAGLQPGPHGGIGCRPQRTRNDRQSIVCQQPGSGRDRRGANSIRLGRLLPGSGRRVDESNPQARARIFLNPSRSSRPCRRPTPPMAVTAENVANQFPELDRVEQEDLAARSHTLNIPGVRKRSLLQSNSPLPD